MNKKVLFLSLWAIFIFAGAGCSAIKDENVSKSSSENQNITASDTFVFDENSFDFGIIKQSGGKVVHDFSFTYMGSEPIMITGVPTSCACTSARVNKTNFNSGDAGILTVTFNPNLHEEPEGKFFKTITFLTDPKLKDMPEVKIWAEIDLDLGEDAYELQSDHDEEEEEEEDGLTAYTSVTAEKFAMMQEDEDFILIDVHIPEQDHIDGTDMVIPYDEIEDSTRLPKDKDSKIVLYCRSGAMSRAAAYSLVEKGYTNVYDLVGGKNAYDDFVKQSK